MTDSEKQDIITVHAGVAEAFSAFGVDVTTQNPGFEGLERCESGKYGCVYQQHFPDALPAVCGLQALCMAANSRCSGFGEADRELMLTAHFSLRAGGLPVQRSLLSSRRWSEGHPAGDLQGSNWCRSL